MANISKSFNPSGSPFIQQIFTDSDFTDDDILEISKSLNHKSATSTLIECEGGASLEFRLNARIFHYPLLSSMKNYNSPALDNSLAKEYIDTSILTKMVSAGQSLLLDIPVDTIQIVTVTGTGITITVS